MIELLMGLCADPPAQVAAATPARVHCGDLILGNGGMMAWATGGALGGQVSVIVENTGAESDRVVSIRTPAGPVGAVVTYPFADGHAQRAVDGETVIQPGRTAVVGELTDLTSGVPMPAQTTITIVFERAGEVTVFAGPVSPSPPLR